MDAVLDARRYVCAYAGMYAWMRAHATNIFRHLTYDSQTHEGFHGVYPACLNLTLTTETLTVNFHDLNVCTGNTATGNGTTRLNIKTALFDKRRTDGFKVSFSTDSLT